MSDARSARIDWMWLDAVSAIDPPARRIEAYRDIGPSEWYLEHHFPGFPTLPGVFLIEAMAHTLGVLEGVVRYLETGQWENYVLTQIHDARFYNFVRPGERVTFVGRLDENAETNGEIVGRVTAAAAGRKIARATLALHRFESEQPPVSPGADRFGLAAYVRRVLPPETWQGLAVQGERHSTTINDRES
jgi:3-hydroxyacyl-[acyl-carrier-protein] dehydratase